MKEYMSSGLFYVTDKGKTAVSTLKMNEMLATRVCMSGDVVLPDQGAQAEPSQGSEDKVEISRMSRNKPW
jgi:hypothetical protein